MVPARLTKPKTFWEITLDDWRTLHPENQYKFSRKSKKDKAKLLDKVDYLTEYALGRITEKDFKSAPQGRLHDLNKMLRYALHEAPKKVKYKINPVNSPEKFTKEWKEKYEEKFTKAKRLKEINETLRETPFKKGRGKAHVQRGRES